MAITSASYIKSSVPAFHDGGKYGYRIRRVGAEYFVDRCNTPKYRTAKKTSGPYATVALAQAAANTDLGIIRPSGVTPTATTAGFTQPAVGATVVVPVAATTGFVVGMSATIATAGTYQITNIAALNVTFRNLGAADAVAPTTAVTTGKAVTAVAGPG